MRAAVYCRKSTTQNVDEDAKSTARQAAGGRAFAASKGWELTHVYTDEALSGYLFKGRAEFMRMLRDAEAGAFDVILLYDLDRFGRNSRRTMEALHALADAGVDVVDFSNGQAVDLESFEGETMTFLRSRFAEEEQRKARKRTRDATLAIAKRGHVPGGTTYGYRNVRVDKHTERVVFEPHARVVRDIYSRFAAGESINGLAANLNHRGIKSPRGASWSGTAVRYILRASIYRGSITYGKTKVLYGRELGPRRITNDNREREKGQIPSDPGTWTTVHMPSLRLVDTATAARVDARLADRTQRDVGGRPPKTRTFLLTGGLLLCPTCWGHFETRHGKRYVCSNRRRKGTCANALTVDIATLDAAVVDSLAHAALSPAAIKELLATVTAAPEDEVPSLDADLARVRVEIRRLADSIAAGVPPASVAPAIQEREAEAGRLESRLRAPRPAAHDAKKLRAALEQTAKDWRDVLKGSPIMAKALIRRLVGPLTLWEEPGTVRWSAENKATDALLSKVQVERSPRANGHLSGKMREG